jgi:hypothetical protein
MEGLAALLAKQAQTRRPTWSVLRRQPSLAAAAIALLALFFSAGYVQGNLMGRRAVSDPTMHTAVARPLPTPPELGLPILQTASTISVSSWGSEAKDSVGHVAPLVDSL